MKRVLAAIALVSVSMASLGGFATAQEANGSMNEVQVPTIPAPVAVELDSPTTALLMLDFIEPICAPRPGCPASLPAVANLLGRARAANVKVIYTIGRNPAPFMAAVAPLGDEPRVGSSANKFFNTDLNDILADSGIETAVIVGVAANGAVLYTSFGANERGYRVVVAEDGISAGPDFDVFLTRYQLLNQPGFDNPQNNPLTPGRVTLSRTDLITFR